MLPWLRNIFNRFWLSCVLSRCNVGRESAYFVSREFGVQPVDKAKHDPEWPFNFHFWNDVPVYACGALVAAEKHTESATQASFQKWRRSRAHTYIHTYIHGSSHFHIKLAAKKVQQVRKPLALQLQGECQQARPLDFVKYHRSLLVISRPPQERS